MKLYKQICKTKSQKTSLNHNNLYVHDRSKYEGFPGYKQYLIYLVSLLFDLNRSIVH